MENERKSATEKIGRATAINMVNLKLAIRSRKRRNLAATEFREASSSLAMRRRLEPVRHILSSVGKTKRVPCSNSSESTDEPLIYLQEINELERPGRPAASQSNELYRLREI